MHCDIQPKQKAHICYEEGRRGNLRLHVQKIRGAGKTKLDDVSMRSTLQACTDLLISLIVKTKYR